MPRGATCEDTRDLLSDEGSAVILVVNIRQPQDHRLDAARGKMDNRGDAVAGTLADFRHRMRNTLVGGQVNLNRIHAAQRLLGLNNIESDDPVAVQKTSRDCLPDKAAGAGNEGGRSARLLHVGPLEMISPANSSCLARFYAAQAETKTSKKSPRCEQLGKGNGPQTPRIDADVVLPGQRLELAMRVAMQIDCLLSHLVPGPERVMAEDEKMLVE
jgi:hypothetical protein